MAMRNDINEATLVLAMLKDTALLRSIGIIDDIQSYTESDSCASDIEELECREEEGSCDQKEKTQQIQAVRRAIGQKAKRIAAKKKATGSLLKRKIPKRVSRVIQEHPNIGKDIEEFVKSKRVGADTWRRTGVFTFDGSHTKGKK
ncbi:Hypothetical predicted protein, partial [Paramuricea clavata]